MTPKSVEINVEAEIDRLYQLPLDEFVAARNGLAARLKSSGNKGGAAQVRTHSRPSVAAWAVNQVYWTARREFDAFLASSEQLRHVQVEGAPAAVLREATKARRETQAAVVRRAESALVGAGHGANSATLQRVANTFEALAPMGAPTRMRPGRLVHDLEPPGFDAFAGLANASAPLSPHPPASRKGVPPGPRVEEPTQPTPPVEVAGSRAAAGADRGLPKGMEEVRAALAEAERRLERARWEAREAAGTLSVAQKRAEGARAELEEATRRSERAKERVAVTSADEAAARERVERLAAARDEAETVRDAALRAVRNLE